MLWLRALLPILFAILSTTRAALVNRTIDDTFGDPTTGQNPTYLPGTGIWQGQACTSSTCVIQPDKSLAFDGTWMAATYTPSLQNINITLSFTGVSIWVFFILANNLNGSATATNTECNFTLDGTHVGYFLHQPDLNNYNLQYNVTAFNKSGLSNSPHQLVISTSNLTYDVYVNFDYAVYTADLPDTALTPTSTGQGSTSASSSTLSPTHSASASNNLIGVIAGSVLGGLAFIIIVCMLILFRRLRRSQNATAVAQPILGFNESPTTEGYRDNVTNPVPRQYTTTSLSRSDKPRQWTLSQSSRSLLDGELISGRSPSANGPSSSTGSRDHHPSTARSTKSLRDELRTMRQIEINERLRSAQQRMNALTTRQTVLSPESERLVETGQEMETMREQIRRLTSQIELLQQERQSDGLSNDLPPAYS